MQGAPNIGDLETRLANGERYLDSNPDDKEARALYFRLTAEYVSLKEIEKLDPLWLHLPPGVEWSRRGSALQHDLVRVLFHGDPEDSADITIKELAELVQTIKLVKEAK